MSVPSEDDSFEEFRQWNEFHSAKRAFRAMHQMSSAEKAAILRQKIARYQERLEALEGVRLEAPKATLPPVVVANVADAAPAPVVVASVAREEEVEMGETMHVVEIPVVAPAPGEPEQQPRVRGNTVFVPVINDSDSADEEETQAYLAIKTNRKTGLSAEEVTEIRAKSGFNEVAMEKESNLMLFLKTLWGIAPIIMEITVVVSLALQDWIQAGIVFALLAFNSIVGFAEEVKSKRSVEELQNALEIEARVLRAGEWKLVRSRELVPGDIIRLRHGDMVPADVHVEEGKCDADQSALTGESKLFHKKPGSAIFAGSVLRVGEVRAVVVLTGKDTKFNETMSLVSLSAPKTHSEGLIARVVAAEMGAAGVMILVALIVFLANDTTRPFFSENIPVFLVLFLTAAPVTLPPMFTLTMALGSLYLSKRGVLVTRLNASEDAASMSCLCSDKTGTLTSNHLAVMDKITVGVAEKKYEDAALLLYAAAASKAENYDHIDIACLEAFEETNTGDFEFTQLEYFPFDASTRKTRAKIALKHTKDGVDWLHNSTKASPSSTKTQTILHVSKGAVETIMDDCQLQEPLRSRMMEASMAAATKGWRTIAVAVEPEGADHAEFVGMLVMSDPPREDSKQTVAWLQRMGVRVIMLTGDSRIIGESIAQAVGIGDHIEDLTAYHELKKAAGSELEADAIPIPNLDTTAGFGGIYPDDKHAVIAQLQAQGHIVGMTGDGVNDAPALKQAEVGIAMSNATDVAKGAASAVLLKEGLSAVPDMVETGRRIHAKLVTWIVLRVSKTFQTIGFVVILFLARTQWVVDGLNLLILLLFVDFVTLALSTDRARISAHPAKWDIWRVVLIGCIIGIFSMGCILGLFYFLTLTWPYLSEDIELVHSICYQILFYQGVLTMFSVRERRFFTRSAPSWQMLVLAVIVTLATLLLCGLGVNALSMHQVEMWVTGIIIAWCGFCSLFLISALNMALFKYIQPKEVGSF